MSWCASGRIVANVGRQATLMIEAPLPFTLPALQLTSEANVVCLNVHTDVARPPRFLAAGNKFILSTKSTNKLATNVSMDVRV